MLVYRRRLFEKYALTEEYRASRNRVSRPKVSRRRILTQSTAERSNPPSMDGNVPVSMVGWPSNLLITESQRTEDDKIDEESNIHSISYPR